MLNNVFNMIYIILYFAAAPESRNFSLIQYEESITIELGVELEAADSIFVHYNQTEEYIFPLYLAEEGNVSVMDTHNITGLVPGEKYYVFVDQGGICGTLERNTSKYIWPYKRWNIGGSIMKNHSGLEYTMMELHTHKQTKSHSKNVRGRADTRQRPKCDDPIKDRTLGGSITKNNIRSILTMMHLNANL